MSENTTPAQCTEAEFKAAMAAGLLVFTTADEQAIHAFAEAIRAQERESVASRNSGDAK